jgi:hypothetical protein
MQQLRLQKTSLVNHPVVFGFKRIAVGNEPMIPKIQPVTNLPVRFRPSPSLPTTDPSLAPSSTNSIQHKDYIVILRATKAFKSPLLRSRDDRCRTIRGVKTFPERYREGVMQERARGDARLGFGDGVQEVLEEKSRAIHVWKIVFGGKHQRVGSIRIASIFP